MGECRDGNVDVIVVAKLDRFTRSSRHLANAMAELEDLGVGFASLAESVDSTTASGRMFRTLLGAFAEFERERITERMMEGHRRIIEAGGWTGGPPPFGYRAVSSGTMKKLALDDGGEAETVRLAVSMVVDQGCSAYEAAKRLNALGKGPRRAARWSHQNLRRVLLDETIAGRWKWGKQSDRVETVTVPIPPIIDVDRFDDLQRVLALTATGPQERRRDYPLTGRVNSVCGSTFTGAWRKDRLRRYYRCRNHRPPYSGEATGPCGCRSLVADDIETVVWETIVNVLSEPDRLLALAAEYLGERASQVPIERSQNDEIERKIADLETAAGERVTDGLKAGIDPKLLKAAADTINQELDSLRRHRDQLATWAKASADQSDRMRKLWKVAQTAHQRLGTLNIRERKHVLELLDIRAAVVAQPTRSSPAQIEITGTVTETIGEALGGDLSDVAPKQLNGTSRPRTHPWVCGTESKITRFSSPATDRRSWPSQTCLSKMDGSSFPSCVPCLAGGATDTPPNSSDTPTPSGADCRSPQTSSSAMRSPSDSTNDAVSCRAIRQRSISLANRWSSDGGGRRADPGLGTSPMDPPS